MEPCAIPLANIVDNILDAAENKPEYLKIFLDWEKVVGKNIASKSKPHKVITAGTKKVLVLKSQKGYALEMQHQSQIILEKVHNFLKEHLFGQLRIIQMDINDQTG